MKVLHCCLAAFYIDNYGYQENILPKIHKQQGHIVKIIASTETYINNINLGYVKHSSYYTSDNIPVVRLPYISWLPHKIVSKLRIYKGFKKEIENFVPDIIFLHDCQFISITQIIKYAKNNKVNIYADSHTDYINSAKNWISKEILNRIIFKYAIKKIEPYVTKFYGTLPLRNSFLNEMYGLPLSKIELLPLGLDTTDIDFSKKNETVSSLKDKSGINETDFVIVTGGKIDRRKNIHLLIEAVIEINNPNIKLLLFGTPSEDMQESIKFFEKNNKNLIKNVGWISYKEIYKYLWCGNIACFPGTHSVIWEQAVALGIPSIFKKWEGITHVDLGGNCLFIDGEVTTERIKTMILLLYNNPLKIKDMQNIALKKGTEFFSYEEIAKKAIGINI